MKKKVGKISPTLFLNSMYKNPSPPMPPHFRTGKAHWCRTFPKYKARLHYTASSQAHPQPYSEHLGQC